ncbi:MAG: hypothetical protein IT376_10525 [Polyangiaceae bacterium]|nr:hypothetical protein [Polyangiaceae bacterium]
MIVPRCLVPLLASVCLASACSANDSSTAGAGGGGGGQPGGGSGGGAASGGTFGVGGSGGGGLGDGGSSLPARAHLRGRVVAPEGTIPISGALVYLASSPPAPIPEQVFCDRCVALEEGTAYAFTSADGTFDLGTPYVGSLQLVVQKGQFRRVRPIEVVDGDQNVPAEFTRLPGRTDKANGDDIPRMAVLDGQWDEIEVTLAKLGMGTVQAGFPAPTVTNASFDVRGSGLGQLPREPFLTDPSVLGRYHIVFVPCSGSYDEPRCDDTTSLRPEVQANLRDWVARGGKLYVTDYSYEFVRQLWPEYVTWQGQTSTIGSACLGGAWSGAATSGDPGLEAWMGAQGLVPFEVRDSWTIIDAVHPVNTVDVDGNPATITPKVWVSAATAGAGSKPTTVSFERGCGRVLFSTYHTEASLTPVTQLLPQERALLYVLLEVGVCVAPPEVR